MCCRLSRANWVRFYGCCFNICAAYQVVILSVILQKYPTDPKISFWIYVYVWTVVNSVIGIPLGLLTVLAGEKRKLTFILGNIIFFTLGIIGTGLMAGVVHYTNHQYSKDTVESGFLVATGLYLAGAIFQVLVALFAFITMCTNICLTTDERYRDLWICKFGQWYGYASTQHIPLTQSSQ